MACLFSLDFFKAYDRVLISYFLKVMKKMRFSDTFCEWIKMMHNGAKTCFILRNLTDDIQLSFSIRQGDPLAMILYVIYIEPLLLHLERKLRGIGLFGFSQILESFCYDVNVVTEHLDDLVKQKSGSPLIKHINQHHPQEGDQTLFSVEVTGRFSSALSRQSDEAVRIRHSAKASTNS